MSSYLPCAGSATSAAALPRKLPQAAEPVPGRRHPRALAAALPAAEVAVMAGQGHEALDSAPELIVSELRRFFGASQPAMGAAD